MEGKHNFLTANKITNYKYYLKINDFIYIMLQCNVAAHTAYYYSKTNILRQIKIY